MLTDLGLIEGFYGRFYKDSDRLAQVRFLARTGYGLYLFAPKNYAPLRRGFNEPLSDRELKRLKRLSAYCHAEGLSFGFGISPVNLSLDYEKGRAAFLKKTAFLAKELEADTAAVLFDDVKTQQQDLGAIQNRIVRDVAAALPSRCENLMFCPAYYSFDPILEKLFGERPAAYFEELSRDLPPMAQLLWTGPKVLSGDITPLDIEKARELTRCPISLWDNYPVNDGKKLCQKLFTAPFKGRRGLGGKVATHLVNTMNEPYLSQSALLSLKLIYEDVMEEDIASACRELLLNSLLKGKKRADGELSKKVSGLFDRLQAEGIEALTPKERRSWAAVLGVRYGAGHDLSLFLKGRFAFDPACLTS